MGFFTRKKKVDKKEENKIEYLKAKDLREHFKITSKQLHEVLGLLKWAVESGEKGWKTTTLGVTKGAKEGTYMGVDYVHWDSKIKNDFEFINAINSLKETKKIKKTVKPEPVHSKITNTEEKNIVEKPKRMTNKEKKEKGDIYEVFIAKHYETQGYTIAEHGKDNGVKDCGIDIIAKKGKEMLFIQCKNWDSNGSRKVEAKDIKYARQDAQDYVEDNPLYEMYTRKVIYIMAENVLHGSAYHYIQKHHDKVEFKIIPMMD